MFWAPDMSGPPLSERKTTIVLSVSPSLSSVSRITPTAWSMESTMAAYTRCTGSARRAYFATSSFGASIGLCGARNGTYKKKGRERSRSLMKRAASSPCTSVR